MNIYLLGTMLRGIPMESLIKAWDGILHRLMHIPTQLLCSRNLQKFKQVLEIMMILILTMIMMTIMIAMEITESNTQSLKQVIYGMKLH